MGPDSSEFESSAILKTGDEVQLISNEPADFLVEMSNGQRLTVNPDSFQKVRMKQNFCTKMTMPENSSGKKRSKISSQTLHQSLTSVRLFKFQRLLQVASYFKLSDHKDEADIMKGKVKKIFPELGAEWLQVVATTLSSSSLTDFCIKIGIRF